MKELLDFYGMICPPCKEQSKVIEEYEKEHGDIKITKICIDDDMEKAIEFGVQAVPTLVLMEDGKEVKRHVGLMKLDQLDKFINE